jgi:hypothetical protein
LPRFFESGLQLSASHEGEIGEPKYGGINEAN